MSFEVRAARADEAAAIVPLYEWLFSPPASEPPSWDPERAEVALRQAIDSHDSAVLVAERDDGELIGFITGYQDMHSVRFGYRAWVEDLAVCPDERSKGVGKSLLDAAKAWARERGATHLELDSALSRVDAHRFYEREGAEYKSFSYGWTL